MGPGWASMGGLIPVSWWTHLGRPHWGLIPQWGPTEAPMRPRWSPNGASLGPQWGLTLLRPQYTTACFMLNIHWGKSLSTSGILLFHFKKNIEILKKVAIYQVYI